MLHDVCYEDSALQWWCIVKIEMEHYVADNVELTIQREHALT